MSTTVALETSESRKAVTAPVDQSGRPTLSEAEIDPQAFGQKTTIPERANTVPSSVLSGRTDLRYNAAELLFDYFVVTAALISLAPFLATVAIAIRMTSPGPAIFSQMRYGRNGKTFRMYKFRTMYIDQCDVGGIKQSVKGDPRITPIGRVLRRTSLDELPQLFNVLKRDMSIVGPRPHVPGMLANGITYEDFDSRYELRHQVRPGLTGLAQVEGFRGETQTERAARKRLDYDLEYIRDQSILLDVKITVLTIWREFIRGSGH